MSPLLTHPPEQSYSPKSLVSSTDFVPIDRAVEKRVLSHSTRSVFENLQPTLIRASRTQRPSSVSQNRIRNKTTELIPPAEDDDLFDEAEDFIAFLSRAGFMAADRRASRLRRPSLLSGTSNPPAQVS